MVADANDVILIELNVDSYRELGKHGQLWIEYRDDTDLVIQVVDGLEAAEGDLDEPRGVE